MAALAHGRELSSRITMAAEPGVMAMAFTFSTWRVLSIAFALSSAALSHAGACEGQTGKLIFEDTFKDDSGGWEPSDIVSIKPPAMLITPSDKDTSASFSNTTFSATDGDYCLEATLPKYTNDDNKLQIGLHIWIVDDKNYMSLKLGNDGELVLANIKANSFHEIFTVKNAPSFKADENAVNAMRIVAKDGKVTVYLNNVMVKATRAQTPTASTSFGVIAQYASDKADAATPRTITVKSYKVTAGS